MHHLTTWVVSGVAVLLLGFALAYALRGGLPLSTVMPQGQQACTQEAKQCPDGSYVGRTGPNCAFAPCPGEAAQNPSSNGGADATLTAKLNQSVTAHGVTLTPLEIVQESRCPSNVVCIQAGTVEVKVRILHPADNSQSEAVFTLGTPVVRYGVAMTLTAASPYPTSGAPIAAGSYSLTFLVSGSSAQ